jgi:hypothetical protein
MLCVVHTRSERLLRSALSLASPLQHTGERLWLLFLPFLRQVFLGFVCPHTDTRAAAGRANAKKRPKKRRTRRSIRAKHTFAFEKLFFLPSSSPHRLDFASELHAVNKSAPKPLFFLLSYTKSLDDESKRGAITMQLSASALGFSSFGVLVNSSGVCEARATAPRSPLSLHSLSSPPPPFPIPTAQRRAERSEAHDTKKLS